MSKRPDDKRRHAVAFQKRPLRFFQMNSMHGQSRGVAFFGLAISLLLCLAFGLETRAQDDGPDAPPEGAAAPAAPRDEINLLRNLNLAPEQVGLLRAIRQQSIREERPLARRLNQARRALDEAIYADTLNEELIRERVREVGEAQAIVFQHRKLTELKVRRVLTPDQLRRLREIRGEAQARQRLRRQLERENRRAPQGDAFNNRPNRRMAPPNGNNNAPL